MRKDDRKSAWKQSSKQDKVGMVALGTMVVSAGALLLMPDLIDRIVTKVYGSAMKLRPEDSWEDEAETAEELAAEYEAVEE